MNPISKLCACVLCNEVKRVSIISTVQAYGVTVTSYSEYQIWLVSREYLTLGRH